jgi:excisionase family DNA binding protein
MALPTFYTPSEVADKLKVNRRSVYEWLNRGYLLGLKAGQSWRITEEELISFMKGRRLPSHDSVTTPKHRTP